MALTAALSFAMLAVVLMAMREFFQFRRQRSLYRLRRLTLRLSTSAMQLFLLASILVGVRVFGLNEPDGVVPLWMAFWGCIAILLGGVFCLVIADFRTVSEETSGHAQEHWSEMAQIIAEHQEKQSKE